jgi:hypothetical protein
MHIPKHQKKRVKSRHEGDDNKHLGAFEEWGHMHTPKHQNKRVKKRELRHK